MKACIKKNDLVEVIAGKEKGKRGKVINVDPGSQSVLIEKLNVVKRHVRPSARYRQGGIIEKESPVNISNVMLVCDRCGRPVKTRSVIVEEGRRGRQCKKCQEVLEK